MRILIVDTCYPAFLDAHYRAHPGLERKPYPQQWSSVMATRFGTSDAYSHNLAKLGVEAHETVVNAESLQLAWAREHGMTARGDALLLEQVRRFEADVVYLQNMQALDDGTLDALRKDGRLVVGQIASASPEPERVRRFDLVLTSFPHYVERFRALGVASEYLRIAFDPRVLEALPGESATRDVVFVGALNRLRHGRGNAVLARAGRKLPVDFWGYDLRGQLPWSPIRRRYRGEAWGLAMYRLLQDARIALNRHIAEAEEYANNMRLYEATGVGALLLTDAKRNLEELFAVGAEVVAYESADDLVEKGRHYLAHEDERRRIAAAGQARTLRDHSYEVRMQELVSILREHAS